VSASCTTDELSSIGEDIDIAIQSLTFPEDTANLQSTFIAGLCKKPKLAIPSLRVRSRVLQGSPGWVWNGGGGRCAQCPPDNGDRIAVFPSGNNSTNSTSTNPPFGNSIFPKGMSLIKKVEIFLVSIVLNDVIPYHPCLGNKPKVDVRVVAVNAAQLNLGCPEGVPTSLGIQALNQTLH
jgi:hypothetical protein